MVVLLAGAGSALAELAATPDGQRRHVCGPGSSCRPSGWRWSPLAPQRAVFVGRAGGLRPGAGRGRRRLQHAGGGRGAPLRPHHPAVLPRRLDRGRHRRDGRHDRRDPARAARRPAAAVRRSPSDCSLAPLLPASADAAAPRPTAAALDVPWRKIAPARAPRWCSSTWSTPPRPPGGRSSSSRSTRPPTGCSPWRRSPTSWPAWPPGSPATPRSQRFGAVPLLRIGARRRLRGAGRHRLLPVVAGGRARVHRARRLGGRHRTAVSFSAAAVVAGDGRRPRGAGGPGSTRSSPGSTSSTTSVGCSARS